MAEVTIMSPRMVTRRLESGDIPISMTSGLLGVRVDLDTADFLDATLQITLELFVSFDGGNTWQKGASMVTTGNATDKDGSVVHPYLKWGKASWLSGSALLPTHVRGAITPSRNARLGLTAFFN